MPGLAQVLTKRESLPPMQAAGGEADVHVGFWRNPKRFNVAITRARALLVVVGHPVVLMEVYLCNIHFTCMPSSLVFLQYWLKGDYAP
jgi:hypothetical protein